MASWSHLPFCLEPMTVADIPAVTDLELAAYAAAFFERDYQREIERNSMAHYAVLRVQRNQATAVIGVAGYWLIADEGHIITIATDPRWQGMGLGEWQLLTMIEEMQSLQAQVATLEVRPSNQPALGLYQKYQFEAMGRRPGYYDNTGEDALILTSPSLQSEPYRQFLARQRAALLPRLLQIKVESGYG